MFAAAESGTHRHVSVRSHGRGNGRNLMISRSPGSCSSAPGIFTIRGCPNKFFLIPVNPIAVEQCERSFSSPGNNRHRCQSWVIPDPRMTSFFDLSVWGLSPGQSGLTSERGQRTGASFERPDRLSVGSKRSSRGGDAVRRTAGHRPAFPASSRAGARTAFPPGSRTRRMPLLPVVSSGSAERSAHRL